MKVFSGDSDYVRKVTAASAAVGVLVVGLMGWATVSAVNHTVDSGRIRFESIMAASGSSGSTSSDSSNTNSGGGSNNKGSSNSWSSSSDNDSKSSGNSDSKESEKSSNKDDSVNSDDKSDGSANSDDNATESSGEVEVSVGETESGAKATSVSSGTAASDNSKSSSDCNGGRVHKVKKGDTLSSISVEYGVSVDDIATANGIWDPNVIYAGSALRIP